MITGANPTPPMPGRDFELMFSTRAIGPYAHDIYGLLVDYGFTDAMYNVDNVPVENFTQRLSTALNFAKLLSSMIEKGVECNGITITEEKYVSPVEAAIIHNLYICIKEMEDDIYRMESMADEYYAQHDPEDDEYAEYHHTMPTPRYENDLDDWQVDNYQIIDQIPSSRDISALPVPLTKEALAPILSSLEYAYAERLRVKDIADRDLKMNLFLARVFALGVPAKNEVFQDLYDCLKLFGRISSEQIKSHESSQDPYAARNYIRLKHHRLKKDGKI